MSGPLFRRSSAPYRENVVDVRVLIVKFAFYEKTFSPRKHELSGSLILNSQVLLNIDRLVQVCFTQSMGAKGPEVRNSDFVPHHLRATVVYSLR